MEGKGGKKNSESSKSRGEEKRRRKREREREAAGRRETRRKGKCLEFSKEINREERQQQAETIVLRSRSNVVKVAVACPLFSLEI